jgi:hypothetical protein
MHILMRITQSISLSNIQTFLCCQERPALGLLKPAITACFQIGVITYHGGDWETVNEFWWS